MQLNQKAPNVPELKLAELTQEAGAPAHAGALAGRGGAGGGRRLRPWYGRRGVGTLGAGLL